MNVEVSYLLAGVIRIKKTQTILKAVFLLKSKIQHCNLKP